MVGRLKTLILIFIAVALFSCKDKKASEIPVSEFFKSAEKSAFKISPDGKYISYLKRYNKKQNIFIQSLEDGKERMATAYVDFPVRDYSWAFDDQIIFNINLNDKYLMYVLDVKTFKKTQLLLEENVKVRVLNKSKQMPDIITIAMNKRDSAKFDVYRLNIKNGELKPYLLNPGNIRDWFVDVDGSIRLAKASDGINETILYRASDKMPFKAIIKNNFKNSVRPIGFTGEKNYFYALSNVDRDRTEFVEINAENTKEERVIYANDKADIQRVDYIRSKHRLELAAWDEAKPKKRFLNAAIKAIYDDLDKQINGSESNIADRDTAEINIIDRDTAENKFIVTTYNDRSRGAVYLYERSGGKLTKLADNSTVNPDELCAMQPIHYIASDGITNINGYLTLPLGVNKTNLPVIVMPHDGPFGGRNSWGYNADVQFLASRGYAVLQVNYRGSSGYGKKFLNAGFREVGGKMQQDITDGVNWLIANKIANAKKIAIYGRGFGGFSALYGVSFNPKLYNCAIVQDGLINFFSYINTIPDFYKASLQKMYLQRMYEIIGDPSNKKDNNNLSHISPVFHPDKIKVPVMIFQNRLDLQANILALEDYVRDLRKRKVQVIYKKYEKPRTAAEFDSMRVDRYTQIEKFLDNNMRVKH